MSDLKLYDSLSHSKWNCKLWTAEHNLHYAQQKMMLSNGAILPSTQTSGLERCA